MVKIISIENLQEWNNYRNTGVGASEVPTLLGYNNFQSKLELWHKKIGKLINPFTNRKMLRGLATEEFTSQCYMAWCGIESKHAEDMQNKKYYRNCEKYPKYAYLANDNIPHLFVSPDRKIYDDIKGDGTLEIKDTSSMYLNAFDNRISISHIIQTKTQMFVGEFKHGTLAYIIDGANEYKEHSFDRDGIIFNDHKNGIVITEDKLKDEVKLFWETVLIGRELNHKILLAKNDFNLKKSNEYQAILDSIEPEADTTLAYEAYLKDNYYNLDRPSIIIKGTLEHESIAEKYLKSKEVLEDCNKDFQMNKNKILSICKAGHEIELGKGKYIKVQNNSKGISIKVKY